MHISGYIINRIKNSHKYPNPNRVTTEDSEAHIVILVECFYPYLGGGALSQWKFAQKAVEKGHQVTVFTPRFEDDLREETAKGVEIRRPFPGPPDQDDLNSPLALLRRILFNAFLLPYLLYHLRRLEPTVLYSPSHLLHPVAKILSLTYRLPLVQFIGFSPSIRPDHKRDIQFYLEQLNFQLFMGDIVFARNTSIVEQVAEHNPQSIVRRIDGVLNTEDIYEAARDLDPGSIRAELGVPEDVILLCWVGRFVDIKDPETALDTVDALPDNYHLVMVGDGPEFEHVQEAASTGHGSERIHLTGRVSHTQALRIIGSADGLLLTSDTEAYPTVVFEALSFNTSVYATSVGVLPDLSEEELYLAEKPELPSMIHQNCRSKRSREYINEEILQQYSMDRFSETVLVNICDFEYS